MRWRRLPGGGPRRCIFCIIEVDHSRKLEHVMCVMPSIHVTSTKRAYLGGIFSKGRKLSCLWTARPDQMYSASTRSCIVYQGEMPQNVDAFWQRPTPPVLSRFRAPCADQYIAFSSFNRNTLQDIPFALQNRLLWRPFLDMNRRAASSLSYASRGMRHLEHILPHCDPSLQINVTDLGASAGMSWHGCPGTASFVTSSENEESVRYANVLRRQSRRSTENSMYFRFHPTSTRKNVSRIFNLLHCLHSAHLTDLTL